MNGERDAGHTATEAFPREQQRVRDLLDRYRSVDGAPNVDVKFEIAAMEQVLRRASEALASGDLERILGSYYELKGCV